MSRPPFPSLRVAGGLLPADLFGRVLDDRTLAGREPADYGFGARKTVREAASRAFDDLTTEWHAFTRDRERGRSGTRDWLRALFDELGFGILTETPAGGLVVEDKPFMISHTWQHVPIHMIPWAVDLDHRTRGVVGAATAAPQSMVQELLNRTDRYLWAILSNGQKLRLLRDSRALAGSAYVEFDLELIFNEQLFSDFVLLFRLVHASRFALRPDDPPSACWLERWRSTAEQQGERAKERLRIGVEQAINTLGTGFLRHPANADLRERLASGRLARDDYKRAVLRLVYRLLFWFVAEDRDVLLDPEAPAAARDRYARYFSAVRLRERARRRRSDHHEDLWDAVRLVFVALGSEEGEPRLALPGIGGIFERITRTDDGVLLKPSQPDELDEPLDRLRLTNEALTSAVRSMAVVDSDGQRRRVDFLRLDTEELGSVYESLLELHPVYDPGEQTFTLAAAAGNERKTTGSYYTPPSLVSALLDSALDPVLDEAAAAGADVPARIEALLGVTVCDPACGSGHFLVAAARRIARRIAQLRSGENEPSPDVVRHAMREVVARCIYGVDINEMAVELAKVSLWLESVEPGRPLPFLDANIRVGNSLLGATPALLEQGIPQDAFKPLTGDERAAARTIAKLNDREQQGQFEMFSSGGLELPNHSLASRTVELVHHLPRRLADVYAQRRRLRQLDQERLPAKRIADAWCAAFVQEKTPETAVAPITDGTLHWIGTGPSNSAQAQTAEAVDRLARDYRFFHWHIEFPHVFEVHTVGSSGTDPTTGWRGGFTCVIGNPPWERVKLQEQEFFATRRPEIAQAKNAAARKKLIAALPDSDEPADRQLHAEFTAELRHADGWSHLLRTTGRYPLTGRGDINTYAVFAEAFMSFNHARGSIGVIVPTGIATDTTTAPFFRSIVARRCLDSLLDFVTNPRLWPEIGHQRYRFALLVITGRDRPVKASEFATLVKHPNDLPPRGLRIRVDPGDLLLVNPNTGTSPLFESQRDADITLAIYRRLPILLPGRTSGGSWNISFRTMFHMANDSLLFHVKEELEADGWTLHGNCYAREGGQMLPLYEAKLVHHFDHRLACFSKRVEGSRDTELPRLKVAEKCDAARVIQPRYWVSNAAVNGRLNARQRRRSWLFGWRDICRSTDERTVIAAMIPFSAAGHTLPLIMGDQPNLIYLCSNLSSFVLDYIARQKVAGVHLTYGYMNQLPVLPPAQYDRASPWDRTESIGGWIRGRVMELTYTAYDMEGFAIDHGDQGPPFLWDVERRFWLRAELDAAYFTLYGVSRDDADHILDTFRTLRRNDPKRFFRTKRAILDIYDAMAKAIQAGEPYKTVLDPSPGEGPRHAVRRPHNGVGDHG